MLAIAGRGKNGGKRWEEGNNEQTMSVEDTIAAHLTMMVINDYDNGDGDDNKDKDERTLLTNKRSPPPEQLEAQSISRSSLM